MIVLPTISMAYTSELGIEKGDIVDLDYEGKLQDGTVFDAGNIKSADISPGKFIKGFYDGILGMKVGERKQIIVQPADGYTDPSHELYNKVLIFNVFINKIVDNVRSSESSGSGLFTKIMTWVVWIAPDFRLVAH